MPNRKLSNNSYEYIEKIRSVVRQIIMSKTDLTVLIYKILSIKLLLYQQEL
jgi:hypothetical protein